MSMNSEDQSKFDEAARQAREELTRLLKENPNLSARDMLAFHQRWYMHAGHKRLGAIYRDLAKQLGVS